MMQLAQSEEKLASTLAAPSPPGKTGSFWKGRWGLYTGRVLVLVGFVLAWHLAVATGLASAAFVSSPMAVYAALINLFGEPDVLSHLATTAMEVAVAFIVSVVLGISCAVFLDRNETVRSLLNPYIAALNSMPRVALGPIFILWFGIGMASKIVLAASLGFFIVLVSTMGGLATVDRDMLLMSRLYGASNMRLFWHVRLPWALPSVFAGLKLTLIYCTSGAVIGEMIAAKSGLGLLVQTYSGQFDIASVLAVMLILIVCVVLVTTAFEWIERRLLSWARGTTDVPG
jgi:NitT/TauT family transport system permease protein